MENTLMKVKIIQGDITTLAVDAIVNAANDSITFPCISTGIYGYPIEDAAKIAVREVKEFLAASTFAHCVTADKEDAEMEVVFYCFSERDKMVYESLT